MNELVQIAFMIGWLINNVILDPLVKHPFPLLERASLISNVLNR